MRLLLLIFVSFASWQQSNQPVPAPSKIGQPKQNGTGNEQYEGRSDQQHPDATPVNIQTVNNTSTNPGNEHEEKSSTDGWLTVFTGALVVVAVLQFIAMYRQANYMRRGLRIAIRSARATHRSAQAATASVEAMNYIAINQLRAYVGIKEVKALSHLHPDGHYWWSISPVFENTGATPARNVLINVNSWVGDVVLPNDWTFPRFAGEVIPTIMMPKTVVGGTEVQITGDDLLAIKEGRKYAYIWGSAQYQDVFPETPARITKFCFELSCRGNPTIPASDDNVVEFTNKLYPKHNCADEDC